jgi:hypothetical protein
LSRFSNKRRRAKMAAFMNAMTNISWGLMCCFGAVLMLRGFRGRRVGDHPFCRRCDYDLYGIERTSCPECGADLHLARARIIGVRLRSSRSIILGSAFVGFGLLALGLSGYWYFSALDWQPIKPVWLLTRESKRADTHAAALAELQRRLDSSELSEAQADAVAEVAIAAHADQSQPWDPAWGDFIQTARLNGKLSDERWSTYALQAVEQAINTRTFIVRKEVRLHDPLPIEIRYGTARLGSKQIPEINLQTVVTATGNVLASTQPEMRWEEPLSQPGWRMPHDLKLDLDPVKSSAAGAGEQIVRIVMDVSIKADANVADKAKSGVLCTRRFERELSWTLIDPNLETVQMVHAPSLEPVFRQLVRTGALTIDKSGKASLPVEAKTLPMPLACDVIVQQGAREWPLSPVAFPSGNGWTQSVGNIFDLSANRVTIVLKPDLWEARGTVDITRLWDGELVIRNVPVRR